MQRIQVLLGWWRSTQTPVETGRSAVGQIRTNLTYCLSGTYCGTYLCRRGHRLKTGAEPIVVRDGDYRTVHHPAHIRDCPIRRAEHLLARNCGKVHAPVPWQPAVIRWIEAPSEEAALFEWDHKVVVRRCAEGAQSSAQHHHQYGRYCSN